MEPAELDRANLKAPALVRSWRALWRWGVVGNQSRRRSGARPCRRWFCLGAVSVQRSRTNAGCHGWFA
jgi:hypothetical protein